MSTTRPRNKIHEHLRKVHTLTLGPTGDGMVATGKWLGLGVLAITNIEIGGKLCGPYPARITSHLNQQHTMEHAARQRIPVTENRQEKKNDSNLP